VCSTPFGITEFRGMIAKMVVQVRSCAQRLSASRSFAGQPREPIASITTSAQRLSASRSFAGEGTPIKRFRIRCSTPFGITEFRGRILAVAANRSKKCSTPFGITEFRGLCLARRLVLADVLNAFRHHGVSRAFLGSVLLPHGVVLNAFRHHGVSRVNASSADQKKI